MSRTFSTLGDVPLTPNGKTLSLLAMLLPSAWDQRRASWDSNDVDADRADQGTCASEVGHLGFHGRDTVMEQAVH